jgi:hypothetical protein
MVENYILVLCGYLNRQRIIGVRDSFKNLLENKRIVKLQIFKKEVRIKELPILSNFKSFKKPSIFMKDQTKN